MADVPGQLMDFDCGTGSDVCQVSLATADFPGMDPSDIPQLATTTWQMFTMVGTDAILTTRDTWDALGFADPTAALYAGVLATPLRDVHILNIRDL